MEARVWLVAPGVREGSAVELYNVPEAQKAQKKGNKQTATKNPRKSENDPRKGTHEIWGNKKLLPLLVAIFCYARDRFSSISELWPPATGKRQRSAQEERWFLGNDWIYSATTGIPFVYDSLMRFLGFLFVGKDCCTAVTSQPASQPGVHVSGAHYERGQPDTETWRNGKCIRAHHSLLTCSVIHLSAMFCRGLRTRRTLGMVLGVEKGAHKPNAKQNGSLKESGA